MKGIQPKRSECVAHRLILPRLSSRSNDQSLINGCILFVLPYALNAGKKYRLTVED